jgi:general secretion pathway protein H
VGGAELTFPRGAGERGFTLLELLVVLLLLAVAAGLVAPAVGRSVDAVRLRAEIAGFAALIRHAREQAIASRRPHTVSIDEREHRLQVTAAEELRRSRALPASWSVESVPPHLALRFEPHGTSTGGEYRIVDGRTAYRVTVDPLTGRVRSMRQ